MTYIVQASYTRVDGQKRIDRWAISALKRQTAIETLESALIGFTKDSKVKIINVTAVTPIMQIESLPQ